MQTAEKSSGAVVVRGKTVSDDGNGLYCLNDIWALAGSPVHKRSNDWVRTKQTDEFISAVYKRNTGTSRIKGKTDVNSIIYLKRGRGGGTYAVPVIALAYAEYLEPSLAVEVKETFLRVRGADPLLADEILQKASDTANDWTARRAMSRVLRKEYTSTLQAHGVDDSRGMAQCTDGIYRGFLGRTTKQELRVRNLSPSANLRDEMNLVDLTGVMLSEALATEDIKEAGRHGRSECYKSSKQSGQAVRKLIDDQREGRKSNEQDSPALVVTPGKAKPVSKKKITTDGDGDE